MNAPAASDAVTLRAEGVAKAFVSGRVRTQVLDNLSLSIHAGELTLISGPSGCGKSTLLAILSGLQKVDAGRVFALDSALDRLDAGALECFRLRHTVTFCLPAINAHRRASRWNCPCITSAYPGARPPSGPRVRWRRWALPTA